MPRRAPVPSRSSASRTRRLLVLALAALAVAAAPLPAAAGPAAPAPPPIPASPGCAGGDPARITGVVRSGGVDRRFAWHLPPPRPAGSATAVILAFHGRSRDPGGMRVTSGLDVADALVIYPAARVVRGVSAWEGTLDIPLDGVDVRFVADLLAEVGRHVCVDPRRVHATGESQGGGFTDVLACSAPGSVAAIAPIAGAFYRPDQGGVRECRSGPLRVLEVHGDADPVIGYDGTARSQPIPAWLAGWTARGRCAPEPARRPIPPDVTELRWAPCLGGTEVRHFRVAGGNHGWPGAPSPAIVGPGIRTQTISATREILAFFGIAIRR